MNKPIDIDKIIYQTIDEIFNKYKDKSDADASIIRLIQSDYREMLEPYYPYLTTKDELVQYHKYINYALTYTAMCKDKHIGREIWHGIDIIYQDYISG